MTQNSTPQDTLKKGQTINYRYSQTCSKVYERSLEITQDILDTMQAEGQDLLEYLEANEVDLNSFDINENDYFIDSEIVEDLELIADFK